MWQKPTPPSQTDQLIGQEEDGLDTEFAVAEVEEVFEARSEELHDHDVVVALDAKPLDLRNAHAALRDKRCLGRESEEEKEGVV